jgi:hypothetical protein
MKPYRLVLLVSLFGFLYGSNDIAFAGSKPASGPPPSCQVLKPAAGAPLIWGTVAVDATSDINSLGAQNVDFILRLNKGQNQQFFRLHLFTPINGATNEEIACRMVNPDDTTDQATHDAVSAFVQNILSTFGLSTDKKLVIIKTSVRKEESSDDDISFPTGDPENPHAGSMADVLFWAQ